MSTFDAGGSQTHGLGWPLVGIGSMIWVAPVVQSLDLSAASLPAMLREPAVALAVTVVGATLLGLIFEMTAAQLIERGWVRWARKCHPTALNATRCEWNSAQVSRWKLPVLDAEFRRHEAMNSFARAYAFHFLFGGLAWATQLSAVAGIVASGAGLLASWAMFRVWLHNTRVINDWKVKKAHELREHL